MEMTRAAIYCRVSTEEQGNGWSLLGQLEDCRDYCRRMGYHITRVAREVHSGSDPGRPAFLRTIRAAEDGDYDTLVVWRRNRAVLRRLRSPAYKGTATYNGTRIHVPALVTVTTWETVQKGLTRRGTSRGHPRLSAPGDSTPQPQIPLPPCR